MNDIGLLFEAFGRNEVGLADLPARISNVAVARILHGKERGCTRCFPHGIETDNATCRKNRRSWKHHRKTQHYR